MNRALEEACMEDESENSYDEAPAPSHQMSVRQYLANDDAPHKSSDEVQPHLGHHGYNQKEDKMMNFYQDGPSDQGYSNHDLSVLTS